MKTHQKQHHSLALKLKLTARCEKVNVRCEKNMSIASNAADANQCYFHVMDYKDLYAVELLSTAVKAATVQCAGNAVVNDANNR